MPNVIGIDHIYIAVSDMAPSEAFYDTVLVGILGFRKVPFTMSGEPHIHYFNRHFGFVLRPAHSDSHHDPLAPGLHHLCLRVDSPAEVEDCAARLIAAGIEATPAQRYPEYAPDYVATYFRDPDGVRLEVTNYRAERRARHDAWADAGQAG